MDVIIGRRAAETWPIDRLRPYERNSRRHSAEKIAASIRQWGRYLGASKDSWIRAHGASDQRWMRAKRFWRFP
jgi:hypothetical protein